MKEIHWVILVCTRHVNLLTLIANDRVQNFKDDIFACISIFVHPPPLNLPLRSKTFPLVNMRLDECPLA